MSKIESGDAIMVDKGFNVADLTLQCGAKLHIPPFTRPKSGGEGRTLNQKEIRKTLQDFGSMLSVQSEE